MAKAMVCWARTQFSSTKFLLPLITLPCWSSDSSRAGTAVASMSRAGSSAAIATEVFLPTRENFLAGKFQPGLSMATAVATPPAKVVKRGLDTTFNDVSLVRAVLSPLARGAALPSESSSKAQRVVALPPDAMGTNSLFSVLAFLGQQKIGSASALSGFPLKFVTHRHPHWRL
jgi:hypothetical protein